MNQNNVVLTIGTFDIIHPGHLELLQESAKYGKLFVAVNTDEFAERYKGRRPVQDVSHRSQVVSMIKGVEFAVLNHGDEDATKIIRWIQPDIITIGDDWLDPQSPTPEARYHAQLGLDQAWLDKYHIKIVYIPRTTGYSTTKLRENK